MAILRIPSVREYFKIDALITHKAETLPLKKKGFVEGVKDCKFNNKLRIHNIKVKYNKFEFVILAWQNIKITRELEERHQLNEIRFARAGKGPLIKTYKYDPTKPRPSATQQSITEQNMSVPNKKNF